MSDTNFLKEFLRDFYQKIINMNDDYLYMFEDKISKWIKNIDKNNEKILELMQNHEKSEPWFSGIIGFFYQYGIGCNVDKNKALELYLLTVNLNKDNLYQQFILLKENNEDIILKDINVIVGKYLLSLFYYKDIIIDKKNLPENYLSTTVNEITKSIIEIINKWQIYKGEKYFLNYINNQNINLQEIYNWLCNN